MIKSRTDRIIRVRILLAAIGARRGAAAVLFAVAAIAVAAAAIGPMFLQSADISVLTSTSAAAPIGQTDILAISNGGAATMRKLASAAKDAEHLAGGLLSTPIFTVDVGAHFFVKSQEYEADILARSSICANLHFLDGSCPTRTGDVAISTRSAATAGVGVGAHLRIVEPHSTRSTTVTITALYVPPAETDNSYWRGNLYFDYGTGAPPNVILDPLISSSATALSINRLASPQLSADLPWRVSATRSGASVLASTVATIKSQLFSRYGLTVSTGISSVINVAHRDDNLMNVVVLAIVVQLIVLSLLILYTVGRSTILERRQESEFARRHGFPRSALIALAVEEPAALIVAALPVGLLLAWGSIAVMARTLFASGTPVALPWLAIAAALGACLAGLLAMTLASSDLWRSRVANSRRTKRVGIAADAFALALALTGLLSLLSKGSLSGANTDPLALLAPGLLTLAAALIGLRIAMIAIQFLIARTGYSTRVAWFLALRQIGRRSSELRRLVPLAAATAVLLFAVGSFFLASSNRSEVAYVEVGATKVVDVTLPPGLNFEAAVRRADPSGRQAMAAAAYYSPSNGPVLAVDASRLAAVAVWPSSLSSESLPALARQLSPRLPPGVSFSGDELRLTFDVEKGTPAIELGVNLFDVTYRESHTEYVGPVLAGLHTYTVPLTKVCPDTCRLSSLAPNWDNPSTVFSHDVSFVIRGVAVQSSGHWHAVNIGADRSDSWKAKPSPVHVEPPEAGAVAFNIPGTQLPYGGLLLTPVDLPAATPAIVTYGAKSSDAPPSPLPGGDLTVELGSNEMSIHPLAVVSTLPFIGDNGALVNFTEAQRAITSADSNPSYQVWLAPSASPTILARLRADGVVIGHITTAAARLGVLDHSGIALAYAVTLIVSPIAALLAIGTVMFIIVSDGHRRRREFASLSMSGIPKRTVRRALLLENAIALGIVLVVGACIGYATSSLAFSSLPEFVNGTSGLLISRAVPMTPFLLAVGTLGVVLALAVEITTRSVMRERHSRFDSGSVE